MFIYPVWLNLRIFWVCLSHPVLSRHRFCCYIVFAQRITLTLVRVTHFTHYPIYSFSIYWLFLSVICIGYHSVMDILVGGFWTHVSRVRISKIAWFFLSLLLQCKFANSTLLSLLSFSYFITPYDAQASSALSALIYILLKQTHVLRTTKLPKQLEWLPRDNLLRQLFALVTYGHVKNWFTHLLIWSQTTSCLDRKLWYLRTKNFNLWYLHLSMTFYCSTSRVTMTFNLPKKCFKWTTVPNYLEIHE